MLRGKQDIRSTINANRAKHLMETIRRRIMSGDGDHAQLKSKVFEAFSKYFTELSEPISTAVQLRSYGARDPKEYTELMAHAGDDLESAGREAKNLADSIVASFNLSKTLMRQLDTTAKKVTSKSQDLQHLTERFAEDTIVAGDDFADDSRIDRGQGLEASLVEIPMNQNNAVLHRRESTNVLSGKDVKISILSSFNIYEGKFYALQGQARPEGGRFHFTGTDHTNDRDNTAPGAPPDLVKRFNNWRTDPTAASATTPDGELKRADITAEMALGWSQTAHDNKFGPFTTNEWDMLANNYHVDPHALSDINYGSPLAREVEYDLGAPPKERDRARQRLIDEDPDTFWECEYVINASEFMPQQPSSGEPEIPAELQAMLDSLPPFLGDNVRQSMIDQYMGQSTANVNEQPTTTGPQLTMNELLEKISGPDIDRLDLDVAIVLRLPEPVLINWINLIPHNFSDAAWMEVLDVSTSMDGRIFEAIEGLKEEKFERVLTEDVNSELTPEEVAVTLAPNRFQYTGQGVWTFPTREAQWVRIQLLQKAPIPNPYDVVVAEMTQTVEVTTSTHEEFGLFDSLGLGGLFG